MTDSRVVSLIPNSELSNLTLTNNEVPTVANVSVFQNTTASRIYIVCSVPVSIGAFYMEYFNHTNITVILHCRISMFTNKGGSFESCFRSSLVKEMIDTFDNAK